MVIDRATVDAIIAQARSEAPNEACGLLAVKDGRTVQRYAITNADASPVHFTLDPQEQLHALIDIDRHDWELGAIYHSHTHTRAYPSATDIEMAAVSSGFYPQTLFIIVSLAVPQSPELKAFSIAGGSVTEMPVNIEG